MENEKCSWWLQCANGGGDCWILEPEKCVRFMPIRGNNLTKVSGVIETPPEIDNEKFGQYFSNWIESMGWIFAGYFCEYKEEEV